MGVLWATYSSVWWLHILKYRAFSLRFGLRWAGRHGSKSRGPTLFIHVSPLFRTCLNRHVRSPIGRLFDGLREPEPALSKVEDGEVLREEDVPKNPQRTRRRRHVHAHDAERALALAK